VLILTALAWLSLEALGLINSLLNFYEKVLDVKEGLVISAAGFSPLTALVSKSEIERKISRISNIVIDYYIVAPVLVDGKILILKSTNSSTADCAFISEALAHALGVQVGGHVVVTSVFTGKVHRLEICGYTNANGNIIEASYGIVAKIRGTPPGYCSYAVVRGSSEALEEVARALGVKPSASKLASLAVAILQRVGDNRARAELYNTLMEAYAANFGLHRDFLLHFACAAIVASTLGSVMLGCSTAKSFEKVFRVLRIVGLSKRELLTLAMLAGLAVACTGNVSSLLIFAHVEVFTLDIFGFVLKPELPEKLAAVALAALGIFYTAGLVIGVRREVE